MRSGNLRAFKAKRISALVWVYRQDGTRYQMIRIEADMRKAKGLLTYQPDHDSYHE